MMQALERTIKQPMFEHMQPLCVQDRWTPSVKYGKNVAKNILAQNQFEQTGRP